MVLDRNAKLKKEYQQMMLASFVYAPKKVQITIKLKTISEYACTNQIQKFQLTSWVKVNPLFLTPPNNLPITMRMVVNSYGQCHNASHMMALCVACLNPFGPKSG